MIHDVRLSPRSVSRYSGLQVSKECVSMLVYMRAIHVAVRKRICLTVVVAFKGLLLTLNVNKLLTKFTNTDYLYGFTVTANWGGVLGN